MPTSYLLIVDFKITSLSESRMMQFLEVECHILTASDSKIKNFYHRFIKPETGPSHQVMNHFEGLKEVVQDLEIWCNRNNLNQDNTILVCFQIEH